MALELKDVLEIADIDLNAKVLEFKEKLRWFARRRKNLWDCSNVHGLWQLENPQIIEE